MSRQSFAYLLQKYLAGNATADEGRVVEEWYALLEETPHNLPSHEWEALEKRLWATLQQRAFGETEFQTQVIPLWKRSYFRAGVAAAVVLVVLVSYLAFWQPQSLNVADQVQKATVYGLLMTRNTTTKPLAVSLNDGSSVQLDPGSELQYPRQFRASKREVTLVGTAFFDITSNPDSPFFVHSGRVVTKVLGTSFWVKAIRNSPTVEVSVRTGKVAVFESAKETTTQLNRKGNGVVIFPNQRVTFFEENSVFVTDLVENPVILPGETNATAYDFRFNDTPLSEVLSQLERAYKVTIETNKMALNDCPLTANLNGKSLNAQLELVCAAIQGSYEVKGTTILIDGKGCN